MSKGDKVWLACMAVLGVAGIYAAVHVAVDPDWEFGKTYGSSAETTIIETRTEAETTEAVTQLWERETRKAAHESMTRFVPPETEEPTEAATEALTEAPTESPTPAPTQRLTEAPKETKPMSTGITHYSIEGGMMDPTLQDILYTTLADYGMAWWFPYAIAQARAESGVQYYRYATSKDGKDKGMFQYREKYWAAKAARAGLQNADIYNPVDQIYVYCYEVASRYHVGLTDIGQLISAHKTAGVGYDADYVQYVLGFVQKLQIAR